MTRREKLMWVFFAGVLVFLYLLSSTDLIIKEKKTEIYPVSIIIGDTSDDYYVNFRKGVEQAAVEYNVDVSFITLFDKSDADGQMNLVRREIEDGASAVILEPVDPLEFMRFLDDSALGSPVVAVGEGFSNEQVKTSVGISHYKAGRTLGEAIVQNHPDHLPVYIFTRSLESGYNQETCNGLVSILEENEIGYTISQKESEGSFRQVIEGTVYPGSGPAVIAALDDASTFEAAEIIEGSPVYGRYIAGLYGTGMTPVILNQLDRGTIRGLVVYNQFDEGYLCVEKAVEAIQRKGNKQQMELDLHYIEKPQLRERIYERILYPID